MRGLVLAVLALLIVAGDSGRYAPQLVSNGLSVFEPHDAIESSTLKHSAGHVNAALSLLWDASNQGNENAQQAFLNLFTNAFESDFSNGTVEKDTATYWLEKLVKIENADAAWLLYQILGEEGASERFMRLAAIGDVAEAQLAFAMSSESPVKREKWLVRAASQGYVPAQAALADWYLLHGQQELAKPLLEATATLDMQSAFKYGRLLWGEGAYAEAKVHITRAATLGHAQAKRAVHVIEKYKPISTDEATRYSWQRASASSKACLQRIQPFATSLATIIRADSIYADFTKDNRLDNLSLCVAPPIWLAQNVLDCDKNYKSSGVLGCDITPLATMAKTREFSHAVVFAEQGKANVQNGVMYLDISDAYSVFVHELAHFAGFADEYPMGRRMANRLCDARQIEDFAPPNVVVDSEYWYAPHNTVANWLEIDPATIIAPAKTCLVSGKQAYKPSRRITFMEHHDSGVIPPLYIVLWEQQLKKQNVQRPISMNFFQAFHKSGNQVEAAHWLSEYEAYVNGSQAADETADAD
ncbi:sel1 repeat family protein [Alteromonas sp. 009811495]|uniref:sel1 repeat family protein n=1 Tax=Alteromonas sp. 009811495 TaxID=3002962 RepID=UPI00237E51B9|nr:sel1 repeat family protein [Alteromonas sp. 009811495]WDT84374.1 sel1 repeat family protein [Alteromonas sp. 009811495]